MINWSGFVKLSELPCCWGRENMHSTTAWISFGIYTYQLGLNYCGIPIQGKNYSLTSPQPINYWTLLFASLRFICVSSWTIVKQLNFIGPPILLGRHLFEEKGWSEVISNTASAMSFLDLTYFIWLLVHPSFDNMLSQPTNWCYSKLVLYLEEESVLAQRPCGPLRTNAVFVSSADSAVFCYILLHQTNAAYFSFG